jgi:hypothetical protein
MMVIPSYNFGKSSKLSSACKKKLDFYQKSQVWLARNLGSNRVVSVKARKCSQF